MGSKVLFATGADVDLCDSFICRPGTRTGLLLSLANEQGSLSREPPPPFPTPLVVNIEGLYGQPIPYQRLDGPILVAGGIGITLDPFHLTESLQNGSVHHTVPIPLPTVKGNKRNVGACALHPRYTAAFHRTVALASGFSGPML